MKSSSMGMSSERTNSRTVASRASRRGEMSNIVFLSSRKFIAAAGNTGGRDEFSGKRSIRHVLKDAGGAHAAADAHGDHAIAGAAALHLAHELHGELGAGAAQWVAQGD